MQGISGYGMSFPKWDINNTPLSPRAQGVLKKGQKYFKSLRIGRTVPKQYLLDMIGMLHPCTHSLNRWGSPIQDQTGEASAWIGEGLTHKTCSCLRSYRQSAATQGGRISFLQGVVTCILLFCSRQPCTYVPIWATLAGLRRKGH